MLLVELKPLVGRLNAFTKQALEDGVGLCVSRSHYEITVEHLLVKCFDNVQADVRCCCARTAWTRPSSSATSTAPSKTCAAAMPASRRFRRCCSS
jgi:ATP-dependent Clp protease ATP-binding subunit ClpA